MLMKDIYVVSGSSGETTWVVAAYEDKEEAEKHVKLANDYINNSPYKNNYDNWNERDEYYRNNPYDKSGYNDDAVYSIETISLVENADEYKEKVLKCQ